MKIRIHLFLLVSFFALGGCAYKAYLGLHGSSIRLHPDIHESAASDSECLECHHPDAVGTEAPVTPHPKFKGCLKCHNDTI
jgi:hypothetical protein